MKFSIIIAAYNLGCLVCDAIESCIKQKGIGNDEFEIITINDGSKDDTLEYINKYKNVDNHIIVNKSNGGLSHTRNYGIKIAKGDYILFLDGDDWLADNALQTLSAHIGEYDVIAYPMLYYYNEDRQKQMLSLSSGIYTSEEFIHSTIGKGLYNIIPAQKKIYKREFLLSNSIEFVEGILHEDNPFIIDILSKCSKVFYIDKAIYFYRQNREGSITSQCTKRNFQGIITGIEHIKCTPLINNRDIRLLITDLLIYQAVSNYKTKEDKKEAFAHLRKFSIKKLLIKHMMATVKKRKTFIKAILLIIDPICLKPFTR